VPVFGNIDQSQRISEFCWNAGKKTAGRSDFCTANNEMRAPPGRLRGNDWKKLLHSAVSFLTCQRRADQDSTEIACQRRSQMLTLSYAHHAAGRRHSILLAKAVWRVLAEGAARHPQLHSFSS
jgi:hypothetical protein